VNSLASTRPSAPSQHTEMPELVGLSLLNATVERVRAGERWFVQRE
jgi:hypothetical protein